MEEFCLAWQDILKSLTESHDFIKPCIPVALSSNDFMSFLNDRILITRDKRETAVNLSLPN